MKIHGIRSVLLMSTLWDKQGNRTKIVLPLTRKQSRSRLHGPSTMSDAVGDDIVLICVGFAVKSRFLLSLYRAASYEISQRLKG